MVAGWNSTPEVVHGGAPSGKAQGTATESAKQALIHVPRLRGLGARLAWAVVVLLGLVGVGAILGATDWSVDGSTGQEAANTLLARRFVVDEVLNGGQIATLDTIIAPNALVQAPAGQAVGPDAVKALVDEIHAGVPDGLFAVDDISARNDAVAVRWTLRGTVQAPVRGLEDAANGERVVAPGILVLHMNDGVIVDFHFAFDLLRCCDR